MSRPIIFIPGFPASELRDRSGRTVFPPSPGDLLDGKRKKAFFEKMLEIPGDLVAGPPIRTVLGIAKQAQSLYDLLGRHGYAISGDGVGPDFKGVGWDWRLGIDDKQTMQAIATAVKSFAPRKVVFLLHSTGALVFRAFLSAYPRLETSIEQVLAFGGAWCGTLEALFAVHCGHSKSILGLNLITTDEGANLIGHMQAAYDLFPPDPARTDLGDMQLVHGGKGKPAGPNVDLSWIKAARMQYAKPLARRADARLGQRDRDFGDLRLTNVVGWGGPTWPAALLVKNDIVFPAEDKDFGDGTVPMASASWIQGRNVRTIFVPIGAFVADPIPDLHAHMWESLAVTQVLKQVLEDEEPGALVAAAADSDEAIDLDSEFVTIRITAQTSEGQALPDCVAFAKVNGATIPIPFSGSTRRILRLKREGIRHNVSNDVFRFTIDFKWKGGSHPNLAVSFRAP